MHMLLYLNEDFDDDLLQDTIELLHWWIHNILFWNFMIHNSPIKQID